MGRDHPWRSDGDDDDADDDMMMMMRMMGIGMLKTGTFLFTHSSNRGLDRNPNWKGPLMCIPLMLLPCSWTLFYLLMYP